MSKGHTLQDPYLNILRKERVPVSIYLVNGIKLQGQIESFDQFVVLLKNSVSQMIYKHAISTVVPTRNVRLKHGDGMAGWPERAPFDGILVTAAPAQVPEKLLEQLAPMDNHQGVNAPLCNQPSGNHRLAERGRRCQDAKIAFHHRFGGCSLFIP